MNVGGMRAYSWAKYWSEMGNDVTIITSKARSEFSYTSTFKTNIPENVKIIEIQNPLFKYFNQNPTEKNIKSKEKTTDKRIKGYSLKSGFKKTLNFIKNKIPLIDFYIDWYYFSKIYINRNKTEFQNFDFVISTANPLSSHLIAMYLKGKFGLLWISDYRDLEEQSKYNTNIGFIRRLHINKYKRKMLNYSDLDITVSNGLREILKSYHKDNEVKVINNGYFEENYLGNTTYSKLDWRIVYSGSFYEQQFDITPLFKALELLRLESKIELPDIVFYGSYPGATKDKILENVNPTLAEKVFFKPSVSNEEIAKVQLKASILLLVDNLNSKGVLLTKSYEYLAAQRPIIALINSDSELAQNFLLEKSGYLVGTDVYAIKDFIEEIYNKLIVKEDLSSYDFFEIEKLNQYSRKNQALILLEYIKEAMNSARKRG